MAFSENSYENTNTGTNINADVTANANADENTPAGADANVNVNTDEIKTPPEQNGDGAFEPDVQKTTDPFAQNARYNPSQNEAFGGEVFGSNNPQAGFGYNQNGAYREGASPSQIYTNAANGGAPQYHYGRPIPMMDNRYFYEQQERMKKRRDLKKELRKTGLFPGVALVFFLVLNSVFGTVLAFSPIYESYFSSSLVSSAVGILYSVFVVALSFFITHIIFKGKNRTQDIPFGPSRAPAGKTALIIFGCIGGCMLANYITSFIVGIFYFFGIDFEYSLGPDPTNLKEVILMFVGTAIVPPLTEELALRGFALTHFKKYGNTFAILASAFVFGIFHGNPTQIPFAFICGLFLGYAALATGSVWTSIIIHACVNGLSCLYSAVELFASESVANVIVSAITVTLLVVGVFCAVIYIAKYKKIDFVLGNSPSEELSVGEKFKCFITNPLMIVVTVVFLIEALTQISLVSQ